MMYYQNAGIKEEIDRYLKKNASRQAALGVSSSEAERAEARRAWEMDLLEIEKLDKEFAQVVHAQTD